MYRHHDRLFPGVPLTIAVLCGSLLGGVIAEGRKVELHSFTQEMDFHKFTSRWDASGTCIPLHNHIALSPRASDRYAALWHKYPLHTNNFEIEFTLALKSPAIGGDPVHEQGFAVWYVYENASSKYSDLVHITDGTTDRLNDMGMGMMGYKNNFDGVGVFFYHNKFSSSGEMELKPSASILINDGFQTFDRRRDLPSGHGSYWNYRDTKLTVKIRFKSDDVLVEAKAENQGWVKLIEYKIGESKHHLRPGGYIGLTSMVGATPNQPSERSDLINIYDFHVTNYDDRMMGQEQKVNYESYRVSERHDFFEGQRGDDNGRHAEAIKNVVRASYRVIMELEPLRSTAERTIYGLSTRIEDLLKEMDELKTAVESIDGGTMAEHYRSMRDELIKVSRETMRSNFERRRSLEELSEHAGKLGSLSEVSGKIKNRLESQGATLFYLAVVCLAAVVMVGSGVYAKFRRLEKKHML